MTPSPVARRPSPCILHAFSTPPARCPSSHASHRSVVTVLDLFLAGMNTVKPTRTPVRMSTVWLQSSNVNQRMRAPNTRSNPTNEAQSDTTHKHKRALNEVSMGMKV